nr:uncharacterized protein LOC113830559 [Penaeus vannamei]
MGRENTTSDDWNYTLPNLLEYLDGLLEGGGQPHSNPILPNPNKDAEAPATTLWGALTSSSTPPTTTTTTPAPINKPMFVMNFTLRTTVDTLLQTRVNLSKALDPLTSPAGAGGSVLGLDVDPSDVGLGIGMGVATLSSASSTSSASSSSSPSSSSSASTPDLLLAGNESLVTLDDSFWLAGGNDSANQSHFFGNETSDGLIVDTVGMVITSVILGIMILTTVIAFCPGDLNTITQREGMTVVSRVARAYDGGSQETLTAQREGLCGSRSSYTARGPFMTVVQCARRP